MGRTPKGIVRVKIKKFTINHSIVNELHIDMRHINYGIDRKTGEYSNKRRSNFRVEEIVKWVGKLNRAVLDVKGEDETYLYYTLRREHSDGKQYRMVLCMEKKRRNVLGIITVYRLR